MVRNMYCTCMSVAVCRNCWRLNLVWGKGGERVWDKKFTETNNIALHPSDVTVCIYLSPGLSAFSILSLA